MEILLLQEYHSILCKTMTALGCKRKLLTLDELYKEYHRKSAYGAFALICAAPIMICDPSCGFDFEQAILKGVTPGPGMYCDLYKQIMKRELPLLYKMGAFECK